jgi:hypothetical protein
MVILMLMRLWSLYDTQNESFYYDYLMSSTEVVCSKQYLTRLILA